MKGYTTDSKGRVAIVPEISAYNDGWSQTKGGWKRARIHDADGDSADQPDGKLDFDEPAGKLDKSKPRLRDNWKAIITRADEVVFELGQIDDSGAPLRPFHKAAQPVGPFACLKWRIEPLVSLYEAQKVGRMLKPKEAEFGEPGKPIKKAGPVVGNPSVLADRRNNGAYVSTRKEEFLSQQADLRPTISAQEARRHAAARACARPLDVLIDPIVSAKFSLKPNTEAQERSLRQYRPIRLDIEVGRSFTFQCSFRVTQKLELPVIHEDGVPRWSETFSPREKLSIKPQPWASEYKGPERWTTDDWGLLEPQPLTWSRTQVERHGDRWEWIPEIDRHSGQHGAKWSLRLEEVGDDGRSIRSAGATKAVPRPSSPAGARFNTNSQRPKAGSKTKGRPEDRPPAPRSVQFTPPIGESSRISSHTRISAVARPYSTMWWTAAIAAAFEPGRIASRALCVCSSIRSRSLTRLSSAFSASSRSARQRRVSVSVPGGENERML
jgi:hypothetical protein